jgi:putative phosphotransacetylase
MKGLIRMSIKIPVGVSNRHLHITQEVVNVLFGEGHQLTPMKYLSQPSEFAAQETVTVRGPKGEIENVRILGPVRKITQLEISKTDSYKLGVAAPIRLSGNIQGTPGVTLIGPKGELAIKEGVIIAKRHLHLNPADAQRLGIKNNDIIMLKKTFGDRSLIFDDVIARVDEQFGLDFHIDTDEANAADLKTGDTVELFTLLKHQMA